MPRVRRANLPPELLRHLADRVRQRGVSIDDLASLRRWLDGNPEVPSGDWFKRFDSFILCGQGELVKTALPQGRLPFGEEVR
jgi:hypothetical protein